MILVFVIDGKVMELMTGQEGTEGTGIYLNINVLVSYIYVVKWIHKFYYCVRI